MHLQCLAEKQYSETLPFMKLVKYIKIAVGVNQTKDANSTERVDAELARIKKRKLFNPYMKKLYDVINDGQLVTILETLNIERSLSVHYIIDHVEMTDDAVFSCIAFNEAGFSKETIYLHIIPRKFANFFAVNPYFQLLAFLDIFCVIFGYIVELVAC